VKPCHRFPSRHWYLSVLLCFAAVGSVHAQADNAAGAKDKDKAPAATDEIERMSQELGDLELLRPLLSLNLTQKQVDSIVSTMKEIAAEWRDVKKQDDAAWKALVPEIEKTHAAALTGTPIPKEFDAKIAEAQKGSLARYNEARLKGMKRLLLLLNDSLTPVQKDAVDAWSVKQFGGRRIPKTYQANPSKAPKEEVQALAIAALIERTLLLDRTLILLQQYKPSSTTPAEPAKDSSTPPAPPAP
jgi:hypothetical protein